MKGGAKEYMMDIVKKQWSPIEVYILIVLGLGIVFVREIPLRVRRTAESFLGRIVLFSVSILLTMHSPWINGILFVIFSLLLLSMSPRSSEGFNNCNTSVKVVDDKKLWFVEALLKERPKIIEDDEVKTSAIQDGANSSRSTGGGAAP
jgi:hypothetical protein